MTSQGEGSISRWIGPLKAGDEETAREFWRRSFTTLAEECRRRLERLRDQTLRQVALLKMEGYTDAEVAARLELGLRSVVRKLNLIRDTWRAGGPHE